MIITYKLEMELCSGSEMPCIDAVLGSGSARGLERIPNTVWKIQLHAQEGGK